MDWLQENKAKKSWRLSGNAFKSWARKNIHNGKALLCIRWDQEGVVHYELFKSIKQNSEDWNRTQRKRLSQ